MQRIFSFIAASVMALSLTNCGVSGYKISGDVANADGMVYLVTYEGKMPVTLDSAAVDGGKFSFSGNLDMPAFAGIMQKGERYPFINFFIENSPISIIGDKESKDKIVVSGSSEQDLYESAYLAKEQTAEVAKEFVKNNPNSVAASYVLFRHLIYQLPVAELESLRDGFAAEIQTTSYIQILNERIASMHNSEVGKPFMEIALPTPDGETISLSSVIDGKNYVLLDFWASWCPPCRAENPHVVAAFNKYNELGFTVFGVSLDQPNGKDKWVEAIEKDGLAWTNVSDLKYWECEPAARYGVSSIPSNFLIAPDGTIIAKNLRGDALEQKLEELLVVNK